MKHGIGHTRPAGARKARYTSRDAVARAVDAHGGIHHAAAAGITAAAMPDAQLAAAWRALQAARGPDARGCAAQAAHRLLAPHRPPQPADAPVGDPPDTDD